MKLSIIGLGKMGANMVQRLVKGGHEVLVYDTDSSVAQTLSQTHNNIHEIKTLADIFRQDDGPRIVWLMIPHQFVDSSIDKLLTLGLKKGDIVIDGGNSNYKLSIARGERLNTLSVHFVDCGTSGGVWGLEKGYSLMVGGDQKAIDIIRPILKTLAPGDSKGWGHVGPVGSGHYVKMVHNGIEYGMMQAFAEGFELMESKKEWDLDMKQISNIWQDGSVVRSWLLDLIADGLKQDAKISSLSDYVEDSGEGRWTIEESIENAVPTPVLSLALQMRFRSRQNTSYAGKILNMMRAGFGGHPIKPSKKKMNKE